MKKCALWILLLFCGFPLFAQTTPSYYIYIAPVSGVGKGPEDNAFFAGSLAMEVTANNHVITGKQNRADFTLTPELGPIGQNGQLYLLHIALTDSRTRQIITEQELIYSSLEEADSLLRVMADSAFSAIAAMHGEMDAWRNKWLYLGGSVFWPPRIYYGDDQSTQMVNFGAGILLELQFLNFMAVETGVTLVSDWVGVSDTKGDKYRDLVLEIPLLLKFALKPAAHYMIEPYGGIHANFSLYKVGRLPLLSWRAGLQYGVKAGQGILFIDACYSMDIGSSSLTRKRDNATIRYDRYMINLSLGYKYGFLSRHR
jgi:hypothetical protein